MNFLSKSIIVSLLLLLYSCADYKVNKTNNQVEEKLFSASGFALVYEERLYDEGVISKKIRKDEIIIFHSKLKKNTPVKIINPDNSKVISTKINNKAKYPNIFVIILSKKAAKILNLDLENPFVEILEVKKNKTFIAKEGKIFDEEKEVANKAPVEKIEIADLSKDQDKDKETKIKKKRYNYILVISDFYYLDSAENLKIELIRKSKLKSFQIKKINNKKYRLYMGPFKNFTSLKSSYISLNKLGFNELNIYKE